MKFHVINCNLRSIADDMGLGKTIMMISLILETTEAKENDYNSGCSSDEDIDNWDQEKHQSA